MSVATAEERVAQAEQALQEERSKGEADREALNETIKAASSQVSVRPAARLLRGSAP